MQLLIYADRPSPRLRYTLDVLFGALLPCTYRLTHDKQAFSDSELPRINYSAAPIDDAALHLLPCGLLAAGDIAPQAIEVFQHEGLPAFFGHSGGGDLPFDLFALLFYQLSRYEEYLVFRADRHDRFPASESLAGRAGFLGLPLVDRWAQRLGEVLRRRFPRWSYRAPAFSFLPTYDVDLAWAYRHRGWWRQLGGTLRHVARADLKGLYERLAVLGGRRSDPFQTFSFLDELHRRYELQPRYFFLLGDRGPYDLNASHREPELQALIRRQAQRHTVGIHPSYRSNEQPGRLPLEIRRLEQITGRAVRDSRQHYLRLRLPHSYRHLLSAGIRTDYSMGFADAPGFRAGTAQPFFWYDLKRETPTPLNIVPFQVMDGTLKNYLGCPPDQVMAQLAPLIEQTRQVGGQFCTLWHNSSFSSTAGWAGWKKVYEKLVDHLAG